MKLKNRGIIFVIAALLVPSAAGAVDWSKVEGKTVKAFYPGVSSWEFLLGKDHGKGANVVKKGKKPCAKCHVSKAGEYDINSGDIISGKLKMSASGASFEPEPQSGMAGLIDVEIQAAYDADNIYLKVQWKGSGASVKDASLAGKGLADKIAVQVSNKIKRFARYGCFITCHNDQAGMPGDSGKKIKLYGYYTRSKGEIKPRAKLDKYLSKGLFIDLWKAAFEGDKVIAKDQYILEDRVDDDSDAAAEGGYANGKYSVVFSRKLSTGDSKDIALKEGESFNIGIAIHDNKSGGRKHYTTFPVSIGLGAEADIAASKL